MEQLATKGKKCKLEVCTVCENSTAECDAGSDDFVDCEKCGLSIHKICFKLSGDLLNIFQDFEKRNEKFPFTILCPECRQFSHEEPINKVQVVASCEGNGNLKNPFEIDCIVKVIVDHLNIQDMVNVRLVNKLWNQNACRILSRESRQVQIRAYNVKTKFPVSANLEKCLQIVQSSDQKKLMKKWIFQLNTSQEVYVSNQILTITKPTSVKIIKFNKLELEDDALFSALLTNISENIVELSLDIHKVTGLDSTQFCKPKFSKLKLIKVENLFRDNYEFVNMIIENSPKLTSLGLYSCYSRGVVGIDILTMDNYITEKSRYCLLTEKSAQNLQTLEIRPTEFNFETFEMKLKTLSLHTKYPQNVKFGKLKTFLTSQNHTLEKLKVYFRVQYFRRLEIIDEDGEELKQMDLPRLDNVLHFELEIYFNGGDRVCSTHKEIWPVKPIHLAGKLPNLKKISINYCHSWALSFETGQECPGVTELVLTNWTRGDMRKLVCLFPRVEILNLKNLYAYICPILRNLNGWSENLKRIEISCEYYHLENFEFRNLVCLKNLESLKISKITHCWGLDHFHRSHHFIYPDFSPLFKIATLTQVILRNFKISNAIVEDLRKKYPSLDYSFYP